MASLVGMHCDFVDRLPRYNDCLGGISAIQRSLGLSIATVSWVSNAYVLGIGMSVVLIARIAGQRGTRPTFIVG